MSQGKLQRRLPVYCLAFLSMEIPEDGNVKNRDLLWLTGDSLRSEAPAEQHGKQHSCSRGDQEPGQREEPGVRATSLVIRHSTPESSHPPTSPPTST